MNGILTFWWPKKPLKMWQNGTQLPDQKLPYWFFFFCLPWAPLKPIHFSLHISLSNVLGFQVPFLFWFSLVISFSPTSQADWWVDAAKWMESNKVNGCETPQESLSLSSEGREASLCRWLKYRGEALNINLQIQIIVFQGWNIEQRAAAFHPACAWVGDRWWQSSKQEGFVLWRQWS